MITKGFVSGNFNTVHAGHLRMLQFARSKCSELILALHSDNTIGVDVPFVERKYLLDSLKLADQIIEIHPEKLQTVLSNVRPDIVIKGKEFEDLENVETKELNVYGGTLIFYNDSLYDGTSSRFDNNFNSIFDFTSLLKDPNNRLTQDKVFNLISKFNKNRIAENLKIKVVVFGDLIIDRYIDCHPIGMSQEDPTLVVQPKSTKDFIGGAGVVAKHLASLGLEVHLHTVVGSDPDSYEEKHLAELKEEINFYNWNDSTRQNIIKIRYRSGGKTLLRVNKIFDHDIDNTMQDKIFLMAKMHIANSDAIVFADFNYGFLPDSLVLRLIDYARQHKKICFADSQSSSQIGDVSRFLNVDLVSATERETRLAVNDFKSGIQVIAAKLVEKVNCKLLILKLGKEGALLFSANNIRYPISLGALNDNPIDVAGAGDAMLSMMVAAKLFGMDDDEAFLLSNIGAAIQCARVGNLPIGEVFRSAL